MRHLVAGRKLKRTSSHRKALLKNLATSLFEHKKIQTTEAKAKELRPYAEHLITRAKNALKREKTGLLPDGQKIDVHNRRIVARDITRKAVLQELFDVIAPSVEQREGGYLRIVKAGIRRGDAGQSAIIELVDFSAPLDGTVSLKARRKAGTKKAKAKTATATAAKEEKPAKKAKAAKEEAVAEPIATAVVADEIVEAVVVDEPIETTEEPIAEVSDETAAPASEEEKTEE